MEERPLSWVKASKLEECLAATARFLHLKAPAGAGKTFVALHMVLQLLQNDPRVARVLWVPAAEGGGSGEAHLAAHARGGY